VPVAIAGWARREDLAVHAGAGRLRSRSRSATLYGWAPSDPCHLARPVPVDSEQYGAEHDAVVPVELVADRRDQFIAHPGWVLVPPGGDGYAGPSQVRGAVFPEPHSRLRGLLNSVVRSMTDASSPSRISVDTGSVPRREQEGKGS